MKTVLITGGSRGIGKALVQRFLSEGYFVIGTSTKGVTDITHENLLVVQLDLMSPESIRNCADKILNIKKTVDILINNAAALWTERVGDTMELQVDILRKTLEVDLIGVIDFTLRIVPIMSQGGHIINISSRQGSLHYVHEMKNPSYQISKAGLNMFTKVLSCQLKDTITVSSVHPGAVLSGLAAADANMLPEESANYIYDLAISKSKTGQFWFKGEPFPW
ncbi:MAG: SDR family NAD(P)-dependent oxidoreductase [Patescibacteria group bacterium]|nr:SDR family NAD(P)-dependent oxidoreductase [Patescibacteria group bacterium]